jgi:N6-L-threonylcarbamoyladenine synthase
MNHIFDQELAVLGIESSCDETGAAVYSTQRGLISNQLFSQIKNHAQTGGVIPERASREHMEKIITIVDQALIEANITFDDIDVIAVTCKPGLPGALMVGVAYAKALAFAAQKPIIGVDHLQGHVFSACIENQVTFPFLALTASGGHSSIYLVRSYTESEILATTRDDAAGEAFDKVAKLMNLPYPGGPEIEKLAEQVAFKDFFTYPRGTIKNNLDFSFSGLKTAVLYHLLENKAYDQNTKKFLKPDDLAFKQQVASSLLVCIADIFEDRIKKALIAHPEVQNICFVGGVACNKYLRSRLNNLCQNLNKNLYYPTPKLCTDNAGMIAFVGHFMAQYNQYSDLSLKIF